MKDARTLLAELKAPLPPISPPKPVAPVSGGLRTLTGREARRLRRKRDAATKNITCGPEQPSGLLLDRLGRPVHGLANLWYGAHLFVVLSGPSLNTLDLSQLSRRGVITLAVNNAATVVRPTLWVHGDPSGKFHEAIWRDPDILKFIPSRNFGAGRDNGNLLRHQNPDGTFRVFPPEEHPRLMPGTVAYQRNATFCPETYLTEGSVNWGNSKKSAARNQLPHVLNIMFVVFRLAHYLGFRTLYLLGCDFRMDPDQPYAFAEDKHAGGCQSNNGTYLKLNTMLGLLKPHFEKAGLTVYNCNKHSGLLVFPHLDFTEGIARATAQIPTPIQTTGWYSKERAADGS